jgi:hypothetical protein
VTGHRGPDDKARAQARGRACDRYRSYLSRAREFGVRGSIEAARIALDSASGALDEIAELDIQEAIDRG